MVLIPEVGLIPETAGASTVFMASTVDCVCYYKNDMIDHMDDPTWEPDPNPGAK